MIPRCLSLLVFTLTLAVVIRLESASKLSWQDHPGYRAAEAKPNGAGRTGFTLLPGMQTGVSFTNLLTGDAFLTNAVAHNGSGVAIGDVDGDDLPDLYLCNLQGANALFRNLGAFKFARMEIGAAACAEQMSTGAVFADADGDADLDLLVNGISAGTRLFLNDGKGGFAEMIESGLSRTASATSLALADIDGDGDLDLYCAHYIDISYLADPTTRFATSRRDGKLVIAKVNDQPASMPKWKDRFEVTPDGSVRELPELHGFYRNEGGGRFKSILFEPGMFSDPQGKPLAPYRDWGLAVMFRDVNGDGAPDFYVANDNASPDRFWINTGKGTFWAIDSLILRHASRSSMGLDFADLNRDGRDDFFVLDMMSREHPRRQTQAGQSERESGLDENILDQPRYNRNALFMGRTDGSYAETALFAGVAATDWSWCPMFLDVDLDGYEDLLITNGFDHDILDQDTNERFRFMKLSTAELKRYRKLYPAWHTENAAYRNLRNGKFEPASSQWGFNLKGVSNGMAAGDLDNDGDLDLVINNLNAEASLYRNDSPAPRIAIRLKGMGPNSEGVGARLKISGSSVAQTQEMMAGGRYLSGDQTTRVFAAGKSEQNPLDLEVKWRSGSLTVISNLVPNSIYEVNEASAKTAPVTPPVQQQPLFVHAPGMIDHTHQENPLEDWDAQPLITQRLSRSGPGIAWFDFNSDGWDDLLIPSARSGKMAVFASDRGEKFTLLEGAESALSDQTAIVGWADGLGNSNFIIAESNVESADGESRLTIYSPVAAPVTLSAGKDGIGALAVADLDGDGDLDLFAGGRGNLKKYPQPASSAVWLNEKGTLKKNTSWSAPFENIGLVNGALLCDLDNDGRPDLALATEWGPVKVFKNTSAGFKEVTKDWGFAEHQGLWRGIAAGDFNSDGKMDIAAGNWGRNSTYELYQPGPLRLYFYARETNAPVQLAEAFMQGSNWFPIRDRKWFERGMPEVAQRFPSHQAFAAASIQDLWGPKFEGVKFVEASHLESVVFMQKEGRFESVPLPVEAQISPVSAVNVADFNGDGIEDIFLGQNHFGTIPDQNRNDAGRGLILTGKGDGTFEPMEGKASGVKIYGEQRGAAIADFNQDGRIDLAVAQNNAPAMLFINKRAKPGLRVILKGPKENPSGIGTRIRLQYSDGTFGPQKPIAAGSGYFSHDSPIAVLGRGKTVAGLEIKWPRGKTETIPAEASAKEIVVHVLTE